MLSGTVLIYAQTKHFNSAHQIFGLAIIVAMIIQLMLGFMHHRIQMKTMAPTKLAPVHVWLGRVVIVAGLANGFLLVKVIPSIADFNN